MKLSLLFILFSLIGCAQTRKADIYAFNKPPLIGSNPLVGDLFLGGFSGLDIVKETDETLELVSLTDRGPNSNSFDFDKDGVKDRGFLIPHYGPQILKFSFDKKSGDITLIDQAIISLPNNKSVTGLPNQSREADKESFDEKPFLLKGKKITPLTFQRSGLDPEGIVIDRDNNYWVVEEYGASILKISPQGKILKRLVPNTSGSKRYGQKKLPSLFGKRRLNRGFEGVTILGDKLYAILQSPIPKGEWKKSRVGHILEIDLKTEETSGHYLYYFDAKKKLKIGALATNGKQIFVLEHNGKRGKKSFKRVYSLDIDQATNIINSRYDVSLTREQISNIGIKPVKKKEVLNLDQYQLSHFEKIEGMVVLKDGSFFMTVDNDFGVGDLIDEATGKVKKLSVSKTSYFFQVSL